MNDVDEEANLIPITPKQDEADEFSQNHLQQETEKYNELLERTLVKANIVIAMSLVAPFLISTRHIIIELYMMLLSPETSTATISSIIAVGYIWYAIFTFVATWLGDKYGHDKTMLFAFLCNGIGVFLEAIAPNLWVFTLGFFVNRVQILTICHAYILYMLPHKHAVLQRTKLNAAAAIVYLIGPVVSGFIVDYANYRAVFWLNTAILAILIVLAVVFVHGSQDKLQTAQRALSDNFVSQQEHDNVFPICNVENAEDASWSRFFDDVNKNELIALCISVFQHSICWAFESIIMYYLAIFLKSRFSDTHISLLYTAGMILCITIPFAVVNIVFPHFIPRVIPKYLWLIPLSSGLFIAVMCGAWVGFHSDDDLILYWAMWPVVGVLFGLMDISTSMCMIEICPKQHSGKATAADGALLMLLSGLFILIVGLLWSAPYYNAFWIGNVLCGSIIFALSFVVWWIYRSGRNSQK